MEIQNLCLNVELNLVKCSLKLGYFADLVTYNKPKTMVKFWEQVAFQIKLKELREARKAERQQYGNLLPSDKSQERGSKKKGKKRNKQKLEDHHLPLQIRIVHPIEYQKRGYIEGDLQPEPVKIPHESSKTKYSTKYRLKQEM